MSFSKVYSAQTTLLRAGIITIEVDLSKGLHSFTIVGLPDKAVEESRDRISAAIKNSGFKSPKNKNQKVVISLAPADLKKEGPVFDLAMAVGYLLASEEIKFDPAKIIFFGELALDGKLRPIPGILPLVKEAKRLGFSQIFLPEENAREAALIDGIAIFGAKTLKEVVEHLNERTGTEESGEPIAHKKISPREKTEVEYGVRDIDVDFADIKGQEVAKRGLEIAAAGGHNVVMYGPPGTGKTMLAKAFAHLLPPLSFEEILETTSIHSVAGTLVGDLITQTPFRSPHHSASYVSLVGGGAIPKPGEITLAHRGVLFLDEFPEFDRRVIDSLRQPLEDRRVTVSRARGTAQFPAHFILIAAMNPCPCGNYEVKGKECVCSPSNLARYQRKISGPIVDRVDLWLEVSNVDHSRLMEKRGNEETTSVIQKRVLAARKVQAKRFGKTKNIKINSDMGAKDITKFVNLDGEAKKILDHSAARLGFSGRAYHKIIKLAQTIADLEKAPVILQKHILEAIQYRPKK